MDKSFPLSLYAYKLKQVALLIRLSGCAWEDKFCEK